MLSEKVIGLFFPAGRGGKRGACLLGGVLAGMVLAGAAGCDPQEVVIPQAARVDLSHVGVHTHENFVRFETGALDVAAMRRDAARYPRLTVRGGSRLPTDHAALPPEWASPGDAPLDNPYGPIQGQGKRPGWGITAGQEGGKNWVKVIVPTRFANWVALQPEKVRRRYLDPHSYSLRVRWESPPAPNSGGAGEEPTSVGALLAAPSSPVPNPTPPGLGAGTANRRGDA